MSHKAKYVDVKLVFHCKVLEDNCIELVKVHIDKKFVDLLTKVLTSKPFAHCRDLMGIG